MAVEWGVRRDQQVERLERRRRLLEVDTDRRNIVLNRDVVSRRVRFGVRAADGIARMPLNASIGPARGEPRKGLARRDVATDGRPMRARVRLPDRRCRRLYFGGRQQTRSKNSQRGCNLSDRG